MHKYRITFKKDETILFWCMIISHDTDPNHQSIINQAFNEYHVQDTLDQWNKLEVEVL